MTDTPGIKAEPDAQEAENPGVGSRARVIVAALLMALWDADDDAENDGEIVDDIWEFWKPLIDNVPKEHWGDCNRKAQTCLRCSADHYLKLADKLLAR